jgi:hypothetical protein
MGSDVSPYPPEHPGCPGSDELAELLKFRLLELKHVNPLLRSLVARIEALEARQDNVVDPGAA